MSDGDAVSIIFAVCFVFILLVSCERQVQQENKSEAQSTSYSQGNKAQNNIYQKSVFKSEQLKMQQMRDRKQSLLNKYDELEAKLGASHER
ncbi:MAG: hypothetical protein OCD00_03830 [Colwellia sp.]